MPEFDDLPHASRTLLLATLELEIAQAKCTNILDLAHKREVPIQDIWRDICRKTAQPRCTVPAPVMVSRDQWLASLAAARPGGTAAAAASASAASAPTRNRSVNAGVIAVPMAMKRAKTAAPSRAPRDRSQRAALVAGLFIALALGAGALVLIASPNATVAPQASLQGPNATRSDVVHGAALIRNQGGESARPQADSSGMQPPQGTIRRLEGISNSFSKR
jgi:hypothetical protein